MGTNELVEKILADGRTKVAAIGEERDKAIAETQKRAAAEVAAIETEYAEQTRRACDAILERARSRARMEKRNAVLAARWQTLDRAVKRAEEKLLGDPGYADFVTGIVKTYARPESVASLSEADTRAFGARVAVKLGEPASISGGVMIRTGKEEMNFALGEALLSLRDELARDLSQILFGVG
ncbi:V-type ATP synthase subunit E [candidate division WOR-3 bacterium]|nr:V-type ATP synthase subunit E [candidate division WOR-3 bacterium]